MAWNVCLKGTYLSDCQASLEISVPPSVFLQSSEYCFFWFFRHSFQEETEMVVFAWQISKLTTQRYVLFSYVEAEASWPHLRTYNVTNTHLSTQLIFFSEILSLRFYAEEQLKNLMDLQSQMGRTIGACFLVPNQWLSLPSHGLPSTAHFDWEAGVHVSDYFLILF